MPGKTSIEHEKFEALQREIRKLIAPQSQSDPVLKRVLIEIECM